jgi:murein DD-endopeptidase MepM/ murein hydrolase activator NlpD
MKNKPTFSILLILCAFSFHLNAQQNFNLSELANDAAHPCISEDEYFLIENRIAANISNLDLVNMERSTSSTLLDWPLKPAASLTDCEYYHIAAFVDQNTNAGLIQDFSCGSNTYDGHTGTDIATWPFNFYKMDNDLVEVIAAAPGIIIDKHDGEFDRNCASNALTANYVVIQHADGSVALYWHMKNGSITTVAIGQPVSTGDHLGIVGSSGSSSGPHLHFEVWSGNTVATRKDPYSGACNLLNASSWWNNQKPAVETAVMRASTHSTDVVMPGCPTTETLNDENSFVIPYQGPGLPAGYAKFYIFLRDEISGLQADLKIMNPDNSTYLAWTYNSPSNNKTRYWGWSKVLPVIPGIYTFEATYNGTTCSSQFEIINGSSGIETNGTEVAHLYPNPSNGKFTLETEDFSGATLMISTLLGETIVYTPLTQQKTELDISTANGIYFYQVISENKILGKGRLILNR